MFKQKAQGVVEFALVLPLFLLLIIGTIYFGMAFSDYLAKITLCAVLPMKPLWGSR